MAQENQPKDLLKAIEAKLDKCQQITAKFDPEQEPSFDDDDDDGAVSYQRYSQFKSQQETADQEFIQRWSD